MRMSAMPKHAVQPRLCRHAALTLGLAVALLSACATTPPVTEVAATPPAPPAAAAPATPQNLPKSLSPEAQAVLAARSGGASPADSGDIATRRAFLEKFQADHGALQRRDYAVELKSDTIAGVPVRIITPAGKPSLSGPIFLNLHGGGFNGDSGSLTENIPIAALTGLPVVAVLYRLGPEHPFPASADDALAVYRELLKTHAPGEIGVYGTSAGAILGPQLMIRLQAEKLPMPAVLGVFSGDADMTRSGQSAISHGVEFGKLATSYFNGIPPGSPTLSPIFGDLTDFPPTLCMTSTDDFFLSSTSTFCRALEAAGVENKLVVFDGLPHAFWAYIAAPESTEAFRIMANYLKAHLPAK